jgi:hypothetical protein
MIEIFLEAPIELKLMILGAIGAFIAVAYNGIRGTDEAMGVGYLIALSLFTVGIVIIGLCILLDNI